MASYILFYSIPEAQADHWPYVVKHTADNGFIMGGTAIDYDPSHSEFGEDGWLVKVDSFGCLVPGCEQWDGVEEIKTDSITVLLYPNPSDDFFNFIVHANNNSDLNFSINSILGAMLSIGKIINDATMMLSTKSLSSGIYFLNVMDQNKVIVTKKIIVQH